MSAKMSAGYAAEEVSRSGETVSKLETDRNGRPLVLVADDEEDILILVSIRLDRAGCEVVTATNGKHALDLILERRRSRHAGAPAERRRAGRKHLAGSRGGRERVHEEAVQPRRVGRSRRSDARLRPLRPRRPPRA